MATANNPFTIREVLNLQDRGIDKQFFRSDRVTVSEKCICVHETSRVVMVDLSVSDNPWTEHVSVDSLLWNPESRIFAVRVRGLLDRTVQDHLSFFDLEKRTYLKECHMPEQVSFWNWVTPNFLGLVTRSSVYHWYTEGESKPVKMFDRHQELADSEIISYRCDPLEKWFSLIGITLGAVPEKPRFAKGIMQLISADSQSNSTVEGHAASFVSYKVPGNENPLTLISVVTRKRIYPGCMSSKLYVTELGAQPGKEAFTEKESDLVFPIQYNDDYPVAMQISHRCGLIYVITRFGQLYVNDLGTATAVCRYEFSPHPIITTSEASLVGGFYAINCEGHVLLATVDESTIVPFVRGPIFQRFHDLLAESKYKEAAELAADSGILRTPDTFTIFQNVTPPLLQYFNTLLTKGKLSAFESFELSRIAVNDNNKILLGKCLDEDKLECTEELGDLVMSLDNDLALKIYTKARAALKVINSLARRRDFDNILIYSEQVGYTPITILELILRSDSQVAVDFALMMSQMEGGCPVDYNSIIELFVKMELYQEATTFLLKVLQPNLPEHASLQTKVLEFCFRTSSSSAEDILKTGMFSHYDRPHIAQLCEESSLYFQALQHYTKLSDIKRVIVNTHAIEPQALVGFFGTLSREWALECMKDLLLDNLRKNLQIIVKVAKEHSEQLGVNSCIEIFEQFQSYDGLYSFLGSYLSSSEDPDIHFKYIETAAMTGQIKEVERVTKESNFYDAEKTMNFLMRTKLPDAQPLINVCDRYGFVPDLIHYLYNNNMLEHIESYVQKVNPGNAPFVVGQLLDDECPEDFVKGLILSVRSLLPVETLVEECEKRDRLQLLTQFLEHLVSEGSQNVHVHNALGKNIINSNINPEHYLKTNKHYDTRVVGKYCEKYDPELAMVVYRRGQCDDELIDFTNKESLFGIQTRYVVERMDAKLWDKVLRPEYVYRQKIITGVVKDVLPRSKSPEQFSAVVKAITAANLPQPITKLMADIVFGGGSASRGNSNMQDLLFLRAIKADTSNVMHYIDRLDNFDGPAIGKVAVEGKLYEEAFAIFKTINLNVQAVSVLLDNIQDIGRAVKFALGVNEDAVWRQVAKAQLVSDAIESLYGADDATQFLDVIPGCSLAELIAANETKAKENDREETHEYWREIEHKEEGHLIRESAMWER